MENTKVCVYAICKNEILNIQRWLECIKGADLVCIVDTGSTDGSKDILRSYCKSEDIDIYEDYNISPDDFSFSYARNIALKAAMDKIYYASKNTDEMKNWVLVSLDLDEFLEEGSIDKIREAWNPNYDTMEMTAKNPENGGYIEQIVNYKIHSISCIWIRDVHETLLFEDKHEKDWVVGHCGASYIHDQDKNKPRNYYNILLHSYRSNNDKSIQTLTYLAQESIERNLWDDAYKFSNEALVQLYTNEEDNYYMDYQYILCINCYLAEYYFHNELYNDSYNGIKYCIKIFALGKYPKIKRIYKRAAEIAWKSNNKREAIMLYYQCLEIKQPPACWIEDFDLYKTEAIVQNYIDLSNAYYYCFLDNPLGCESIYYAELACKLDPDNELVTNNLKFLKDFYTVS